MYYEKYPVMVSCQESPSPPPPSPPRAQPLKQGSQSLQEQCVITLTPNSTARAQRICQRKKLAIKQSEPDIFLKELTSFAIKCREAQTQRHSQNNRGGDKKETSRILVDSLEIKTKLSAG
jgi:hypothetical protein